MSTTRKALLINGEPIGYFPPTNSEDVTFDNTGTNLNSTDVEGAIKELDEINNDFYNLTHPTVLTSSNNLDTLLTVGTYYWEAGSIPQGIPTGVSTNAMLTVEYSAGISTYIQTLRVFSDGIRTYDRRYFSSWSDWSKVARTSNSPVFSDTYTLLGTMTSSETEKSFTATVNGYIIAEAPLGDSDRTIKGYCKETNANYKMGTGIYAFIPIWHGGSICYMPCKKNHTYKFIMQGHASGAEIYQTEVTLDS